MKLLQLNLLAYGPFTDQQLDFRCAEPALQLVFGANEAGKSSALRAITALLFGIEERTSDDHLHRKSDLRIGGQISWGAGQELALVRRKGRKGTLLGADGEVLDEALLTRALGGASRALFSMMFGLDHNTLRAGAQALLAGGGEVGESLFDAGGARGVHQLLERLRGEADALYKARGSKQELAQALKAFAEARKAVELAEMLPAAYVEQEQRLAQCKAELADLIAERQQLAAESHQLGRVRAVFKPVARLRDLRARLSGIGEAPGWLVDARPAREAASQQRQTADHDRTRLCEERERLSKQIDAIAINEALVAIDAERITEVQHALGNHRKAAQDLPKRQGELAAVEQDALLALRQVGAERGLDTVEALRLDVAAEARIEKLALAYPALMAELGAAERQLATCVRRGEELADSLATVPVERPTAPLKAALRGAERQGDVQARLAAARRDADEAARAVRRACDALGSYAAGRSAEELAALALPAGAAIERFEQQRVALEREHERQREQSRLLVAEVERVRVAQEALSLTGAPPTLAELEDARADRDGRFQQLLAQIEAHQPIDTTNFQQALARSDALADQLWQQADRVAQAARLSAEQAGHERSREHLVGQQQELQQARADWELRWQALWQPAAIQPGGPAEMLSWLDRHAELVQLLARQAEALGQLNGSELDLAHHRETVVAAWQLLDDTLAVAAATPLPQLLDAASAALERQIDGQREAASLTAAATQNAREQRDAQQLQQRAAQALQDWQQQWAGEVAALGLSADVSVQEVSAVRARLRELFSKVDKARDLRRRIDSMKRDASHFADLLQQLAAAAKLDELAQLAPAEGAAALLTAHQQAVAARLEKHRLRGELASKNEELGAARSRMQQAQAVLNDLFQRAGVTDLAQLELLEGQAAERRGLEQQLDEVAADLLELGDGRTLNELEALAADSDADQARARLEEVGDELHLLGERIDALKHEVTRDEVGLEQHFHRRKGAFEAALDKQVCLARVRQAAERYAKLRLATLIVEHEIERYRQQNQGPIVAHASELFQRLTLDRYRELRVDFAGGDEPELRCVRADDSVVGVAGLSDGTRDQLYLALRLASLQRYAQRAEMLPFVLDDILVHFDDDRARAALSVLSELSGVTQILFFTHHSRLLELAREVVPAARLREHVIGAPAGPSLSGPTRA